MTTSSQARERISIVIETKGNWNLRLENDLEDQLVERYLAGNECRNGIYLVGWFASAQWDPGDWRRAAAGRRDQAAVTEALVTKAKEFSIGGLRVEVRVLDTRM